MGLLGTSGTYSAKINPSTAPHAPIPGLYLPPQTWISRFLHLSHCYCSTDTLWGAGNMLKLIHCGKGWYFVWKSGKYLLFYAKHDVSSPFQSTQLLSLAQIKGVFLCWAGWKCAASACWCNFVIFRFTLVSTYYHCHWKALFRECR